MLFLTSYKVSGTRYTGTYIVNAASEKEANAIIKSIDEDYINLRSWSQEEYDDEEWDDLVGDDVALNIGEYQQLECGT